MHPQNTARAAHRGDGGDPPTAVQLGGPNSVKTTQKIEVPPSGPNRKIVVSISPFPQHFTEAARAVATAKIEAFTSECSRLAELAIDGIVDRAGAIEILQEIALANSLTEIFWADFISGLVWDAFSGCSVQQEAPA